MWALWAVGMRFQFTPLREGRLRSTRSLAAGLRFQFTPLREGRHGRLRAGCHHGMYFNSRPCVRGDPDPWAFNRCHYISIHAPA